MAGLAVECYAGYRGEQTPRRFILGGATVEIAEILDCWLAPDHRYFKARGSDGGVYILRQDSASGDWDLTMFEAGAGAAPRPSGSGPRGPSS